MRPWLRGVSSLFVRENRGFPYRNTFLTALSSGKVLVNCQMGMSRSSTCVLAYLILRHQMSADEALNTVSIRQIVNCLSHPLTLEVDFIWIFCCGRTFLYAKILLFSILYALMV